MLGKILLTLAVILGAWLVIRLRLQRRKPPAPPRQTRRLLPPALLQALAVGLVAVMVSGSLLWLYLDWESGRGLVNVRVINANTGEVTSFQARRQDIGERQFTTLDGRRVTLAEIERMVLDDVP